MVTFEQLRALKEKSVVINRHRSVDPARGKIKDVRINSSNDTVFIQLWHHRYDAITVAVEELKDMDVYVMTEADVVFSKLKGEW